MEVLDAGAWRCCNRNLTATSRNLRVATDSIVVRSQSVPRRALRLMDTTESSKLPFTEHRQSQYLLLAWETTFLHALQFGP